MTKTLFPDLKPSDLGECVMSPCGLYRYTLWRRWSDGPRYAQVIGLNPSKADGKKNERNAIESIIAASVTAERGRCADICSRIADDELVASREPGIGPMLSFERVSRSRIAMKCEEEIRNPTPRDEPGNRIKTDCRSF